MFVIWSNIHGGVLGGLFTSLIAAAGWTLAWQLRLRCPLPDIKALATLWVLILLCFATPLVSPYGLKRLNMVGHYEFSAVSELMQEHASLRPCFTSAKPSCVTITLLLLLGLFYSARLSAQPEGSKGHWYIPLIWFFLSVADSACASFAMMAVVISRRYSHTAIVRSRERG
jgi:hypothetical protein